MRALSLALSLIAIGAIAVPADAAPLSYDLVFSTDWMSINGVRTDLPDVSPLAGTFIYDPDIEQFLTFDVAWFGATIFNYRKLEDVNRDCGEGTARNTGQCSPGGPTALFTYLLAPGTNNDWGLAATRGDDEEYFWLGDTPNDEPVGWFYHHNKGAAVFRTLPNDRTVPTSAVGTFTAVPEPATAWLSLLGFCALWNHRRLRSRNGPAKNGTANTRSA